MTCERWRSMALLADSGELTPRRRELLESHLQSCEACRQFRDGIAPATRRFRAALPAGEPRPATVKVIAAAAEARQQPSTVMLTFRRPAVQMLACAAALLVVAGGAWMLSHGRQAGRIDDLQTIVAMLHEETAPAEATDGAEQTDTANSDDELRQLAHELLVLQGLEPDDFGDLDFLDEEPEATPRPLSATPTPASRARA